MDYRLLAEEVAKASQDFKGVEIAIRLGGFTLDQEKELLEQLKPNMYPIITDTVFEKLKVVEYTSNVYFSYIIPKTKELEIVELEEKLAMLKGEVAHA